MQNSNCHPLQIISEPFRHSLSSVIPLLRHLSSGVGQGRSTPRL